MQSKFSFLLRLAFVNLVVLTINVIADEPLPPPTDYWTYSANKQYAAFFQVKEKRTTVYQIDKSARQKKKTKLWEMDGWYRNTYLSNDGDNLVVAYEGANLLNLNYQTDQVMISFYDKGNLLNQVRLDQLIENPTPDKLEKTVSHYRWVDSYGLNEKQLFEVNTVEKKKFLLDVKTGLPIGTQFSAPAANTNSNQAPNSVDASESPKQTNPSDTNTKKETAGCQTAVLSIISLAFLGSILIGQQ